MMKFQRAVLLLSLLCLFSMASAQTVEIVDIGDNSMPLEMKITSWEPIGTNKNFTATIRFSSIGGMAVVELRLIQGTPPKAFSMDKDYSFILELADGEAIVLNNHQISQCCDGCAAKNTGNNTKDGTISLYNLTDENLEKLAIAPVVKVSIYTSIGTIDHTLTVADAYKIQGAAKLMLD